MDKRRGWRPEQEHRAKPKVGSLRRRQASQEGTSTEQSSQATPAGVHITKTESSSSTCRRKHNNRVPASTVSKNCAVPESARVPQAITTMANSTPTLADSHTDSTRHPMDGTSGEDTAPLYRGNKKPSDKWQGLHYPTLSSGARVDCSIQAISPCPFKHQTHRVGGTTCDPPI